MAGRKNTHGARGARNHTGVNDRSGGRRVVAPVDRLVGSIGVHRPQRLRIAEVPVHIFPAIVQDTAVGGDVRGPIEQGVLGDLVDIGPVGLHTVKIAHDMPVAHAILGFARGGKHDAVVGQIQGVQVVHIRQMGQLLQPGPVNVDLINMIAVRRIFPHRKDNPLAVPMHSGIAYDAVGGFDQCPDLPSVSKINRLQCAARSEVTLIELVLCVRREVVGVMVVVGIRMSNHEKDRPVTDPRIGPQRLTS